MCLRFLSLLIVLALGALAGAAELEPISRIAAIRALTPEQAAESRPVRIEATVTLYDPEVTSFFVSDGTHGIYVGIDIDDRPVPMPRPGDRLRIEGVTTPGAYLPNIRLLRLERLGSGPPLQPRRVRAEELLLPGPDCDWVEFDAVVTATSVDKFGGLYFALRADGWPFRAYISRIEKFKTPHWDLIERKVRVQCAVGTDFNQERQMCGRVLYVPGLSCIIPEEPGPELQLVPLRLADQLMLGTSSGREHVRLRGVVTMVKPGKGLTLRDASGSVLVETGQPLSLVPGDVVEARGYSALASFRPKLNAVEVTKLQPGLPPEPRLLKIAEDRHSSEHHELITLDARLVETVRTPTQTLLLCSAAGVGFEAWIDGAAPPPLAAGSLIRLNGICELTRADLADRERVARNFQVLLRSPADVAVLAIPSWWTAERLGWLAAAIGGVTLAAGLWVFLLQRQVRAQSEIIRDQTERTATLDERHRIARELHDTLEQDLMGVTMLLEDTDERLNGHSPEASERLGIARRLLRRSREESRSTIRDLRSVALEQLGLATAIKETLQPIATAAGLKFEFAIEGELRKLSSLGETSLLRIAHEGLANAVKHARATRVLVRLEFAAEEVRLEITDDGKGFSPGDVDARTGHFGLQGIRERTNKLGGVLRIASQPGQGTTIRVVIPAPQLASV